jgi:hypothetical protein
MWLAVVVVVLAGCGRLDFDPESEQPPRFVTPRLLYYGSTTGDGLNLEALLASQTRDSGRYVESTLIDAPVLADYDLVVVQALIQLHSTDEAAALASWLEAGGSMVVLSAYDILGDAGRVNSLLGTLGVQLVGNLFNGPITEFAPHPTTANLHSLVFLGGYHVQIDNAFTTIATFEGEPVGAAAIVGRGRIVVWGDDWVSRDADWGNPDHQLFWANVLDWTCHRTN